MKTMVANFRGLRVPEGRNLKQVLVGITQPDPKKIHGYGLGSEFHGYFRVGYPKRLVILGSFGNQIRG